MKTKHSQYLSCFFFEMSYRVVQRRTFAFAFNLTPLPTHIMCLCCFTITSIGSGCDVTSCFQRTNKIERFLLLKHIKEEICRNEQTFFISGQRHLAIALLLVGEKHLVSCSLHYLETHMFCVRQCLVDEKLKQFARCILPVWFLLIS